MDLINGKALTFLRRALPEDLALLWGIVAAGDMFSMSAYFATVLRLR